MANPQDSSNAPENNRRFRLHVYGVGFVSALVIHRTKPACLHIVVSDLKLLPDSIPLVTAWYDDMIASAAGDEPIRIFVYHQGQKLCDYFLVPHGPGKQQN